MTREEADNLVNGVKLILKKYKLYDRWKANKDDECENCGYQQEYDFSDGIWAMAKAVYESEPKKAPTVQSTEVKEIVEHLNQVCKTNYKHTSAKTKTLVKTRLKEGFTLDDFKKVHIVKFTEWNGTDMQKYLRPETLYGTKFESYLNQELTTNDKYKAVSNHTGMSALEILREQGRA